MTEKNPTTVISTKIRNIIYTKVRDKIKLLTAEVPSETLDFDKVTIDWDIIEKISVIHYSTLHYSTLHYSIR